MERLQPQAVVELTKTLHYSLGLFFFINRLINIKGVKLKKCCKNEKNSI